MTSKHFIYIITFCILLFFSKTGTAQTNKEYFFMKGTSELIDGRYSAAIGSFNILIKADTGMYEAYYRRAIAKHNLGDMIGSLKDFDKAIELNPVFTYAYLYRAMAKNNLGYHAEALNDLDIALDLRPEMPFAYYSKGVSYFYLQQFDKAIENFNRYLRYNPKASDGYINRGTSRLFLKDTVGALEDYNQAIALNLRNPDGYSRRARLYGIQGENELALKDLNEAISLDSTNSINYYFRAIALYNNKQIAEAIQDFDKVLELDPYNALTLYNRALMRTEIGDYDGALVDYNKAQEINPSNVLIYYNRAGVLLEKGSVSGAIADYTRAIDLYPDFANAYLNRSYAKRLNKDYMGSKEDYDVAQKKIAEHQSRLKTDSTLSYADTSINFSNLIAFDADFGNKDFSNELIQYQRADITLQGSYKLTVGITEEKKNLAKAYYNSEFENFKQRGKGLNINAVADYPNRTEDQRRQLLQITENWIDSSHNSGIGYFAKASLLVEQNLYNSAQNFYKQAINIERNNPFYYFARSIAQSEMIDFISSVDNNMQTIVFEANNTTSLQSSSTKRENRQYNYDEVLNDLNKTIELLPNFSYAYYNRGNIKCNSNQMPEAIEDYSKAIELYPNFAEAYYNRGLVQIFLKDTEKGCLDISKSGELGLKEAYNVIKRYCIKK